MAGCKECKGLTKEIKETIIRLNDKGYPINKISAIVMVHQEKIICFLGECEKKKQGKVTTDDIQTDN